jgi:hypothetical protein
MTNPNQRIQGAFGDIFTPNTSYTDRAAAQLYAEQKQREAKQQQLNAALDDEFSKNLAGIRDADIPELTQKYTDWKLANMQAMKQKGGISPQQQMDLLRKKAAMYDTIGQSKQQKQWEEENAKGVMVAPDNYEDNAHQNLMQHRQMPLNLLKQNNLFGYDYTYNAHNYKDAADDIKKARGEKIVIEDAGMQAPDDKFAKIYNKYQINSAQPEAVKNFYLSKIGGSQQAKKHYTWELKNLPEDELTKTQAQFDAIPDSYWKLLGRKKPDLSYQNTDDNAHVYATYQAQKAAIENMPFKVGERKEINTQLAKEADQAFQNQKQAQQFAQQKELAGIRFGYQKALKDYSGGKDKANDENVLNTFIENQYNSGQNKYEHIVVGGNKYTGKVVDVPKTIKDKYIIDKGYDVEKQPDEWLMTTDKTKLVPIFFEKDKSGVVVKTKSGNPKISTTKNSAPIDIQNYKVDLGQLLVSQKSRGGQVVDEFEEESPVVSPIIPSKAKKVTDPAILKALNKQ